MSGSIAVFGEGFNFAASYPVVSASTPDIPGAPLAVGTRVVATNGAEWIFVKAGGTVAAGDVVQVTTTATWIASALSNTTAASKLGQLVGVAGAAATVGQFFWMQVSGYVASINATTGMTGYTAARSTSTAGRIDDTITGSTTVAITGIVLEATASSNVAAGVLNFPAIGAND